MRILVTGGFGFIGSNLIAMLAQKGGYAVCNVDKMTYAANPRNVEAAAVSLGDDYRFFKTDICDEEEMERIAASAR